MAAKGGFSERCRPLPCTASLDGVRNAASGARLLTPEDPSLAWCAVARPLMLSAHVSQRQASKPTKDGLVPLLPLIFEKLLGKSLDAAPWGTAALHLDSSPSQQDGGEDGSIDVSVALSSSPPAETGLFEMETLLGGAPVTLRLKGLRDTAMASEGDFTDDDSSYDEEEHVVTLHLPSDWLPTSVLRAAWDEKVIDVLKLEAQDGDKEDALSSTLSRKPGSVTAWRSWFEQWGKVQSFELSAHAGEAGAQLLIALTFAGAALDPTPGRRLAAALSEGRLLVLQEPSRVAFPCAAWVPRSKFLAKAEAAWQQHNTFAQEIGRIDRALVLEELASAVPIGREACFKPLTALLERWVSDGTLHATSTVCTQRRLQEASDASSAAQRRNAAPQSPRGSAECFRRSCWHAAFRVAGQVRPNAEDSEETLTYALCEHWRKSHGVCLEADEDDLKEMAEALREVWLRSSRFDDSMKREAEANAKQAEEALLEELEQEAAKDSKKKQKKQQKKALKKPSSSEQPEEAAAPDAVKEAKPDEERGQAPPKAKPDELPAVAEDSTLEEAAVYDEEKAIPKDKKAASSKKKTRQRSEKSVVTSLEDLHSRDTNEESNMTKSSNLDSILEAVRLSQELQKPPTLPGLLEEKLAKVEKQQSKKQKQKAKKQGKPSDDSTPELKDSRKMSECSAEADTQAPSLRDGCASSDGERGSSTTALPEPSPAWSETNSQPEVTTTPRTSNLDLGSEEARDTAAAWTSTVLPQATPAATTQPRAARVASGALWCDTADDSDVEGEVGIIGSLAPASCVLPAQRHQIRLEVVTSPVAAQGILHHAPNEAPSSIPALHTPTQSGRSFAEAAHMGLNSTWCGSPPQGAASMPNCTVTLATTPVAPLQPPVATPTSAPRHTPKLPLDRPRTVVTCSDLGLDLIGRASPGSSCAAASPVAASPGSLPQVSLPATPGIAPAGDRLAPYIPVSPVVDPMAGMMWADPWSQVPPCLGHAMASSSALHAQTPTAALAAPASWSQGYMVQEPAMPPPPSHFPEVASPPLGAAGCGEQVGQWLNASGILTSRAADLAQHLAQVAPESYED
eukprot:TRINITY_DN15585_c0_g2_i1.p1 TRINITY_DN15585_c0_g2~~TRINITY_DN15585_c0_g2_i1.p1  ORF type:complete len:1104 (-),score=300.91 TRINITY_DN15585_c0_g2_i1:192-3425(-)